MLCNRSQSTGMRSVGRSFVMAVSGIASNGQIVRVATRLVVPKLLSNHYQMSKHGKGMDSCGIQGQHKYIYIYKNPFLFNTLCRVRYKQVLIQCAPWPGIKAVINPQWLTTLV